MMIQSLQEWTQFQFGIASHRGRQRHGEQNEDALHVLVPASIHRWHPPLLIIADGMGGHQGGATASQLAITIFAEEFQKAEHPTHYLPLLIQCAYEAHRAIRSYGTGDLSSMGTTIVAAVLENNHIYSLNIGDSRAYLIQGSKIWQISEDQSWAARQVRLGKLTTQEAANHPNRNRLEMALTANRPVVNPYLYESVLDKSDIIVLCSDGLWGVVPDSLIWAAARELSPQVAANKLVDLANRSGGPDNISVIVARQIDFPVSSTHTNLDDTNP